MSTFSLDTYLSLLTPIVLVLIKWFQDADHTGNWILKEYVNSKSIISTDIFWLEFWMSSALELRNTIDSFFFFNSLVQKSP